jgi:uncharacterized protein with GYD domain
VSAYILLANWTEHGIKNFGGTVERTTGFFTSLVERHGGSIKEVFWTMGEYDLVAVVEFGDDETAVTALLQVGAHGDVRTKTMRAFDAREMTGIISRVS